MPALTFSPELLLAAQGVRVAFFDIGGVLTDGGLYLSAEGETLKRFHILDGLGLKLLQRAGITPVVITGRDSTPLRERLKALGVTHAHFGTEAKLAAAEKTLAELGLDWKQAAGIGDDWPDLPVLRRCALACAPANAHAEVKAIAHHVTQVRRRARILRPVAGRQRPLCAAAGGLRLSTVAPPAARTRPGRLIRAGWERMSVYLPVILMGVMALGTYWLARNTPVIGVAPGQAALRHDPDSLMRRFSIKTFDPNGRLKTEIFGSEGRHYPDTDTLEVDQPRIRSFNARGELTVATAKKAISNADGSEVQLIGDAVVTRQAVTDANGRVRPVFEVRGEFLHAFMDTERIKSHKPVELIRGADRFTGDSLEFDNIGQVLDLQGRVHGVIRPRGAP